MREIDEATHGLGSKITSDTLSRLDEGPFTRTLGDVGNSALLALGSPTARGKLKYRRAATYLMDQFSEYAANKPWTAQTVDAFLYREFGDDYRQLNATPSPQASSQVSSPPPPANNNQPQSAAGSDQGSGQAANANQAPQRHVPDAVETRSPGAITVALVQAAQSTTPNKKLVMQLVNQLLRTAKGQSPEAYKQAIENLQSIQLSYGDKVPQLKEIDLSKFTESHLIKVVKFTHYLVEKRITSRAKIDEAYNHFFVVEAGSNDPKKILSREEIYNILADVAEVMVDRGVISVGDPKWTEMVRKFFGNPSKRNSNAYQNSAAYDDHHVSYTPAHTPAKGSKQINRTTLERLLSRDYNVKPEITQSILKMFDDGFNTSDKLLDKIETDKTKISPKLAAAIGKL